MGNPQLSPLSVAKHIAVCHSSEYQHRVFLHVLLKFGRKAVIELEPTVILERITIHISVSAV